MAEPNIVLTRIDNRLIHGQVATQWTSTIGANLLLVANDDVAANTMRQKLMNMAAPQGVATRYFSIQKTIDVIHKAAPRQHIFLIVENPEDALRLVKGGVPIKKWLKLLAPLFVVWWAVAFVFLAIAVQIGYGPF